MIFCALENQMHGRAMSEERFDINISVFSVSMSFISHFRHWNVSSQNPERGLQDAAPPPLHTHT